MSTVWARSAYPATICRINLQEVPLDIGGSDKTIEFIAMEWDLLVVYDTFNTRRETMLKLERLVAAGTLSLACIVGAQPAQAANLIASETAADIATLVGTQFDVVAFSSTSNGESADGTGAFIATQPAAGQALVVLTEGPGRGNSDWLHLIYATTGGTTEALTVHWRSDADPGGLPALPTGVVPMFLVETGGIQDVTALLVASATASGFAFPSNITIQVQSDAPEAVPEPATLALLSVALVGFGVVRRFRRPIAS